MDVNGKADEFPEHSPGRSTHYQYRFAGSLCRPHANNVSAPLAKEEILKREKEAAVLKTVPVTTSWITSVAFPYL